MADKEIPCRGAIEHRDRQLSVECTGCEGPRSLTDRVCFMGLSGRITPGFSGEVVLRATSDTKYSGKVVEALSACSEVSDMIRALGGKDASRKVRAIRDALMRDLAADPASMVVQDVGELLKGLDREERDRLTPQVGTILERSRRMVARLKG